MSETKKNDIKRFQPDKFPGVIEKIEITDKHVARVEVPSRFADGLRAAKERGGVYVFLCYPLSSPEQVVAAMESDELGPEIVATGSPGVETVSPGLVSVESLAAALECTEKTVQNYADQGIVVRTARGQYDLLSSIAAMNKARKALETGTGDEHRQEKVKELRVKRQQREAKLAEQLGRLLNAERTRQAYEAIEAEERNALLNMPKKLGPDMDMVSGTEAEVKLNDWVRRHLRAFSSWDSIMATIRNTVQPQTEKKKKGKRKKK